MDKENRLRLIRMAVSALLLAATYAADRIFSPAIYISLLVYMVPYLLAGCDVLLEAGRHILSGQIFDEHFLMCTATIGALAIGFLPGAKPEFPEAVFVMLFFQLGEFFEDMAEGRSRRSISQLMDIRPDIANVERGGQVLSAAPGTVAVGEVIVIRPGEKVPIDGVVLEGTSSLDTTALTGESVPRSVGPDDCVISGCVNLSGVLRVRTSRLFGESTVSKILDLVENAGENKSRSENFITSFARYYTPAVVLSSVALAFLPPLLSGDFAAGFAPWLGKALTFLVVSCPCALVISVPLTFFSGIGGASKHGILIKGSNYMETLSRTGTIVFDKTGTLTQGVFQVTAVHPEKCDAPHLLHLASHVESCSTHPIALSLQQAYTCAAGSCSVSGVQEIAGQGVKANVNGSAVCVGNTKMMEAAGAEWKPCSHTGTIVHVAIDGVYAGHIVISDMLKKDSAAAVKAIRDAGVKCIVMLTGDRDEVGKAVSSELGLDEYRAELLPDGKIRCVENLLFEKRAGETLAFVGDGINDAPVLARADVGIAMGAMGSDAAIEAADVVLMDDRPSKIALAIKISKRTLTIARQNIIFALGIKLAVLVMALFGAAPMWLAVFADVGVTVLAVLNASRALKQPGL